VERGVHCYAVMNTTTQQTKKSAKVIEIETLKSRDWVRFGVKHEGQVFEGHHATIRVGESITLHGIADHYDLMHKPTGGIDRTTLRMPYTRTFKIGDIVEVGSFNLTYVGAIVSIGEKVITVQEDHRSSPKRMPIHEFAQRNWNLDLAAIRERNANWSD
jgi:hypothetical protein